MPRVPACDPRLGSRIPDIAPPRWPYYRFQAPTPEQVKPAEAEPEAPKAASAALRYALLGLGWLQVVLHIHACACA